MDYSVLSKLKCQFTKLSKLQKCGSILLGLTGILTIRKVYDIVWRKYYNYPSGPVGLPFIGSLLRIFKYKYVSSYTNSYGPVFMVYVGLTPMIFINDLQIATKYLNKREFSNKNIRMTQGYNDFLEMEYNKHYVFRRQLLHKSFITVLNSDYLNQIGINILQRDLFSKLDQRVISKKAYTQKTMANDLQYAVFSLFFMTVFGKYNKPTKADYDEFMPGMRVFFKSFMEFILAKILFGTNKFSQYILAKTVSVRQDYYGQKLLDLCAKWLNDFEKHYVNDNVDTESEPPVVEWYRQYKLGKITRKEMIADIRVIMIAGIHSTSAFISFMVAWLALLPDLEKKLFEELSAFEKKYGVFQLKHVEELHILRAFVHEVFRFPGKGSFGNLPRAIIEDDIKINGYNIPNNSQIVVGLDQFGHDNSWRNPFKFDIKNWMDDDGKFKNNSHFTKFGIGRRNCPGMSVAKKEIYLLLGRMVLSYRFYSKGDELEQVKHIPDWREPEWNKYMNRMFDNTEIYMDKRE